MPLFIFISGYFAKFNLKKIFKGIFLPYLIIQTLWTVIEFFAFHIEENFLLYLLIPRWTMWFLLSLTVFKLSVFVLNKMQTDSLVMLFILSLMCGLLFGLLDFNGGILSISRTIGFYPFFVLGVIVKRRREKHEELFNNTSLKILFTLLAVMFVSLFFVLFNNLPSQALYFSFGYSQLMGYSLWARGYIYLTAIFCVLALTYNCGIRKDVGGEFSSIGKKTLYYYLLHSHMVNLVSLLFAKKQIHCPLIMSISIVIVLFIVMNVIIYLILTIRETKKRLAM